MKIIHRDPGRVFEGFLRRVATETYAEPDSELHMGIIDRMVPEFAGFLPDRQSRLLDVGCGEGYASVKFRELGYERLTAITLSDEDVAATRARGIECHKMDMTFLEFDTNTFDALWVRHALEHSPFPYLTLLEFNRVLSMEGFVYIEMPAPDTPRLLENWPNHYSVFGTHMWRSLLERSGFKCRVATSFQVNIQMDNVNDGRPFDQTNQVFVVQKIKDEIIP